MDKEENKPEAEKIENIGEKENAELLIKNLTDQNPPATTVLPGDEIDPEFFTKTISVPDPGFSETEKDFVTDGRFIEIKEGQSDENSYSRSDNPNPDSYRDGKSESPEDVLRSEAGNLKSEEENKSEVGSPKSEEKDSAFDIPIAVGTQSEIENKSAIDIPQSEIKEPLTTHNSTLTTMEVHHHPEVEKKGLKEYVLEGLMIFLAVTMGFFAESLREHITNSEHVKQLSSQLAQDLKTDTLHLQKAMFFESALVKKNDSLFFILQRPIAKADTKKIQQLIMDSYHVMLFHQSSGAFEAIKSQLQLKQFSESRIAQYIADYESTLQILKALEKIQENNLDRDVAPFFKLHFTPPSLYAFIHEKPLVNGGMRNLTQNDLTQLSMDMELIQSYNDDMISCQRNLKNKAVKFIEYINKEYNLKNE